MGLELHGLGEKHGKKGERREGHRRPWVVASQSGRAVSRCRSDRGGGGGQKVMDVVKRKRRTNES